MAPTKAIHPGVILKDIVMGDGIITITGLANAMGVSRQTIQNLLAQKTDLTPQMALRLAHVTDTNPRFWVRMQAYHAIERAKENFNPSELMVLSTKKERIDAVEDRLDRLRNAQ